METIKDLIKDWIQLYNQYLQDKLEYPDEAKLELSSLAYREKEIIEFFALPNTQFIKFAFRNIINENIYEKKNPKNNLFLPSIEYSEKLSNEIMATMGKLAELKSYTSKMDSLFKDDYKKLIESSFIEEIANLPTHAGIYVFYENGKAIYVGRSNNIQKRIKLHTNKSSDINSASFAFIRTKKELQIDKKITRKDVIEQDGFEELFINHKLNLSKCKFRYIEMKNDILQTMFEPYVAYKLGTYPTHNTFENH